METRTNPQNFLPNSISNTARRNYNTYLKHYELRNLKPMTLEEFLKNYKC